MGRALEDLKKLRVAYECAVNYDYVPSKDEASELLENIFQDYFIEKYSLTKESLEFILTDYEGHSDSDLKSLIMDKIDEL